MTAYQAHMAPKEIRSCTACKHSCNSADLDWMMHMLVSHLSGDDIEPVKCPSMNPSIILMSTFSEP